MNLDQGPYFQTPAAADVQDTMLDLSGYSLYSASSPVSPAFTPTHVFNGTFPDMAILSSEQTVYYVHRDHILRVSINAFGGLLTDDGAFSISVPEPAAVLDVVLHTIYGISFTHRHAALGTVDAALAALVKYGVSPHRYAGPSQPLYPILLAHAPHRPIEAYAVAGRWGLEDAAVAISAHLLAFDLSRISDELSVKMGPVYLRRLVDLHRTRAGSLRDIVLRPPAETHMCGGARLTEAWAFAAAQLAWDTLPSMSTNALQSTFEKAGEGIVCEDCRMALRVRIQEVCWEWSEVKRTI